MTATGSGGDGFAAVQAALARIPSSELQEQLRAAREAPAELPEPSIIPAPESLGWGRVRFPCPLGCGWGHEEDPGAEPMGPLLLPVDYTEADLNAAITAQAAASAEALRGRAEEAIRDHFTESHPGR
ncbi:MAG TPA: hypothetical protein VK545_21125 [Streptomyces sp.]|nr:hypothetical protein [Streptomyces sp.]